MMNKKNVGKETKKISSYSYLLIYGCPNALTIALGFLFDVVCILYYYKIILLSQNLCSPQLFPRLKLAKLIIKK